MIQMNKKYKKIILFIVLIIVIIIYTMFISGISYDEIWEYGYGYNISIGLIPYRDFNMIVTPLYPILISTELIQKILFLIIYKEEEK